jgi:acid phosphatase
MQTIAIHDSGYRRCGKSSTRSVAVFCAALMASFGLACSPAERPGAGGEQAAGSTLASIPPSFEGLNPTLWVQTAVEYRGLARQSYLLASERLDEGLADPSWTAALEQTTAFSDLPTAVILDIDETVLDNSPYQARLTIDAESYVPATWDAWVQEIAAAPVPGALEFCQYAASQGVTVFYVTNRNAHLEEPTRANLERYGFPLQDGVDTLLLRGERPEWETSDKGPRRAEVAAGYRILLLVGDNMGDFVSAASGSVAERQEFADQHADYLGTRWITLPNPQYGSWEGAVIGYDFSQPLGQIRQTKIDALDPGR